MGDSRHGMWRTGVGTVLLAAVVAAAVACGGDPPPPPPPTGPPGDPTAGPPGDLPGPAEVAIQFMTGGGFAGPCCDPWQVPDLTAYGDGRVLVAGAEPAANPEIRQAPVGAAAVARLLDRARDAGLMEEVPPDTGSPCCDMAYTRVVLADATAAHEFEVTGLGVDVPDLPAAQVRARQAVADLRADLVALVEGSPRSPFTPVALAVYVFPAPVEDGPAIVWPLDRPLAEGGRPVAGDGRCLHLTGADEVDPVHAAAREFTGPVWSDAGRHWTVHVRPLLSHEHDCP